MTAGKPIVLVSNMIVWWISSVLAPAALAYLALLCTAPSERILTAAASLISSADFRSIDYQGQGGPGSRGQVLHFALCQNLGGSKTGPFDV